MEVNFEVTGEIHGIEHTFEYSFPEERIVSMEWFDEAVMYIKTEHSSFYFTGPEIKILTDFLAGFEEPEEGDNGTD